MLKSGRRISETINCLSLVVRFLNEMFNLGRSAVIGMVHVQALPGKT